MGSLEAACVVHQLRSDSGNVGVTAIDKRPVDGPVRVRPLGLYADAQADRAHHGGADKALYAYSAADAEYWESELGRPLPAGWFGENLRVSGIDVSGAPIGSRWQIGAQVVVEVTMPRTPCQTFARWVGGADARGWVKRFATALRPGAYLRVVTPGSILAGDTITVLSQPAGAPTIAEVFAGSLSSTRA
ncbi:MOSC domain-containing protein [Subtercola boreus]|uniref:Sulfurase n=1 Tax=Subtercola boreus TaxID=120213 RepID=A0A3E0WCH6_9MICO|nr:MOSC domain-containing protein [Subtercola boreus]RFA21009.1 sulfurase [Subtercola boreus]RFA21393.1 sulfurase [Subtercola boreus]RFA27364.1 sulfurase [Subtercola boreus]